MGSYLWLFLGRVNMKKVLLTGVAALFLATGTAHADVVPKKFLGTWCGEPEVEGLVFHRKRQNENCDDGYIIRRTTIRSTDGSGKCTVSSNSGEISDDVL